MPQHVQPPRSLASAMVTAEIRRHVAYVVLEKIQPQFFANMPRSQAHPALPQVCRTACFTESPASIATDGCRRSSAISMHQKKRTQPCRVCCRASEEVYQRRTESADDAGRDDGDRTIENKQEEGNENCRRDSGNSNVA